MARENVAKCFAHIERVLTGQDWLAGNGRTLADAYLIGIARWGEDLDRLDIKREFPRLHAHMQTLEADQAVIFAHAIEDGKPATSSGGFNGHVSLTELSTRLAAQAV